jgi:DNA-binding MarR family transcriptional regulator
MDPVAADGTLEFIMGLTRRQQRVLSMIEYRRRYGLPTVQRDLAEALGIRRDSLNKLLARLRRALLKKGQHLELPPRSRGARTAVTVIGSER